VRQQELLEIVVVLEPQRINKLRAVNTAQISAPSSGTILVPLLTLVVSTS